MLSSRLVYEVEDVQVRFPVNENESVARESPGGNVTNVSSVEKHPALSERVARCAERDDLLLCTSSVASDEQQVTAEQ